MAKNLPHGDGQFFRNAVTLGGSINLKLAGVPLRHLSMGGRYRWASNRFFSKAGLLPESTSEHAFELHAIADGRLRNGFLRLAAWADHGSPNKGFDSYSRLAGAIGFEKELVIPHREACRIEQIQVKVGKKINQIDHCVFPSRNEQTIGIEAILGAGRAWRRVPEYAHFYGGNAATDFLHEDSGSQELTAFPVGPILRSAGQQQVAVNTTAGVARGGTSYWHFSLNLSLPIPGLSRPLIPAVAVTQTRNAEGKIESCAKCSSLKAELKNQVAGGESFYITVLARQKLTPEQITALEELDEDDPKYKEVDAIFQKAKAEVKPEADKAWQEITPPIAFIADYANAYSLKPLIMIDAARLGAPDTVNNQTRYAVGGGIQVTVIIAKFEAGYLRTIHPIRGDNKGNFIMRLFFQNIF
jgi:hypothetical protein